MLPPELASKIDDLMRADLEYWSGWWFHFLKVSTALVVIGIAFEGPEVFHVGITVLKHWWRVILNWWQIKRKLADSRGWAEVCPELNVITQRDEGRTPNWIVVTGLIGWVLVVAGVAGEGIAETLLADADSNLRAFNSAVLTEARKETASAFARAAQAQMTASGFEAQIAEAQRTVAEPNLARIKIEAKVAWRHLTDQQKAEIGSKLGDFSKQEGASFWYLTGDTEAAMFATDIAEAVKAAHAVVQPPADMMIMHESGRFGDPIKHIDTGVILQSTKDERSRSLAEAIIRELTSRGFDAARRKDPPFDDRPTPQVWVMVEPRPEGPQGELKLHAEAKKKQKTKSTASAKP